MNKLIYQLFLTFNIIYSHNNNLVINNKCKTDDDCNHLGEHYKCVIMYNDLSYNTLLYQCTNNHRELKDSRSDDGSHHNSGSHNSGSHNSGSHNSSHHGSDDGTHHNSGSHNSGSHNSGSHNSSHHGSDDGSHHNSRSHNSGSHNSSHHGSDDGSHHNNTKSSNDSDTGSNIDKSNLKKSDAETNYFSNIIIMLNMFLIVFIFM
jgi:hypothetical protein